MRIVDNVIALRILKLLITPFNQMDAYKLGVIDDRGNVLVKGSLTPQQKDSYTLLHRIIFKIKQLLNKLPGGESQVKNVLAAYMLVRESYENEWESLNESQFFYIKSLIDSGVVFVEEELLLNKFYGTLYEDNGGGAPAPAGGAPANSVGGGKIAGTTPETGGPVISPKAAAKYKTRNKQNAPGGIDPLGGMARRTR